MLLLHLPADRPVLLCHCTRLRMLQAMVHLRCTAGVMYFNTFESLISLNTAAHHLPSGATCCPRKLWQMWRQRAKRRCS